MFTYRITTMLRALLMVFAFGAMSLSAVEPCAAGAKKVRTVRDFFTTMPEQVTPMLTPYHCLDLMDYYDSKMTARVKNDWGGRTTLKQLDRLYLLMQDDNEGCVNTELALLISNSDTILCVNRTLHFPQAESTLSFYTTEWEPLDATKHLTLPAAKDFPKTNTDGLEANNGMQTISAHINIDTNGIATLQLQLHQDAGFADTTPTGPTTTPTLTYQWDKRKFIRK